MGFRNVQKKVRKFIWISFPSPLPSPILKVLAQFGPKVAFAVQMSKVEATLRLHCVTFLERIDIKVEKI